MEKASSPPNNCPIPWQRSFPFQQPSPFCHPERSEGSAVRPSGASHAPGSREIVILSEALRRSIASPRSFDSAPPNAVPRDKSVRRFAQDDDFVESSGEKHLKPMLWKFSRKTSQTS